MKYLLILLFAPALFAFKQDAPKADDCKKMQEGTFKLENDPRGENYLIVRKGGYQIEKLLNSNEPDYKFVVEWLNDCSYTLMPAKESRELLGSKKLTVEITSIKGNTYTYKAIMEGDEEPIEGKMEKVK